MRTLATLLTLASLIVTAPALAQAPHDARRLFPFEAPISDVGSPGSMARVALPAEVMARARPDLSDVRIHDEGGNEVAYVVGSGVSPWPREAFAASFVVPAVSVERRIENGDSLAPIWREVVRVAPPGSVAEGSQWSLALESSRPSFVRTAVVRFVDGRDAIELARASVFRLADPLRERTAIALPPLPTATSPAPLIEVEIWGEGGYVEPEIRFVETRAAEEVTTLDVPLVEVSRESREGTTVIELTRPAGVVPDRIRLRTTSANFYRTIQVTDASHAYVAVPIGRGSVYRVREIEGAEELEVEVQPASGETLRIAIADGDSPSLEGVTIEAVVRQPVLAFEVPSTTATLRFGGGRVRAPRYDLAALSGTRLGDALHGVGALASLGPVRDNPRFDAGPALGFAMRPGRAVDVARYTHVADLRVGETPEGASRVRLPLSVLAAARVDLADLRIVGADGRQWPYLVAPAEESDVVRAQVAAPEPTDRGSRYVITPPADRARADRIVLHTDAPFLSREYVVSGIDDDGRRVTIGSGMLSRRPEDEPTPIEIGLTPTRVSRIELNIVDLDDAPIALSEVDLSAPSPTLYLAAPAGEYRVLVGDPEAEAPRYELAGALDLVLSTQAGDAEIGAASANPAHVEPRWYQRADLSTWLVWGLLIFAVLALGLLTLRLARTEPAPAPSAPPEADAKPNDGEKKPESDEEKPASDDEPPKGGGSTEPLSF